MNKRSLRIFLVNLFAVLVGLFLIIWFFPTLYTVLKPFIIAMLISYLLSPLVRRLSFFGLKRSTSVLIVSILTLGLVALILVLFIPQLIESIQKISSALPGLYENIREASQMLENHLHFLSSSGALSRFDLTDIVDTAMNYFESMLNGLMSTILAGSSHLMDFIIVPIVAVLFMLSDGYFRNLISYFIPVSLHSTEIKMGRDIDHVIGGFIRGQSVMSLICGILTGLSALILGLPYPVIIGLIMGLTSFVPYFGPAAGTVIVLLLCVWSGLSKTLVLLILIGVIQVFCGNVIAPLLMSEKVGLTPIGIIFAVLFFGQLFGGIGMLFAVPLAGALKVVFHYFIDAAAAPQGMPESTFYERSGTIEDEKEI